MYLSLLRVSALACTVFPLAWQTDGLQLLQSLEFPFSLHEVCLMQRRLCVLGRTPFPWEDSCVCVDRAFLELTPRLALWPVVCDKSGTPKYCKCSLQALQMAGVSGDKLCRFLPLPSILSCFHYLPFVEAVIYCILQPCNLWLFFIIFSELSEVTAPCTPVHFIVTLEAFPPPPALPLFSCNLPVYLLNYYCTLNKNCI